MHLWKYQPEYYNFYFLAWQTTFNVKNECTEKFQKLASECIEASRKEEGNVDYHLYTGKEDKTKFFFVKCGRMTRL